MLELNGAEMRSRRPNAIEKPIRRREIASANAKQNRHPFSG